MLRGNVSTPMVAFHSGADPVYHPEAESSVFVGSAAHSEDLDTSHCSARLQLYCLRSRRRCLPASTTNSTSLPTSTTDSSRSTGSLSAPLGIASRKPRAVALATVKAREKKNPRSGLQKIAFSNKCFTLHCLQIPHSKICQHNSSRSPSHLCSVTAWRLVLKTLICKLSLKLHNVEFPTWRRFSLNRRDVCQAENNLCKNLRSLRSNTPD